MKIVIISEWFSEKMGYAENNLPVALGKLGHDVHVITTDLQIYGTSKDYDKIYFNHLGPKQVPTGIFNKENFTLHRNSHSLINGLHIVKLEDKIALIKPDIVYCFEIVGIDTALIAKLKSTYKYKFFCESRIHLSVFNTPKTLKQRIKQYLISRSMSDVKNKVDLFYPIAEDVLFVINKYYGIPKKKCHLASLGVDTDLFSIIANKDTQFRENKGFTKDDIVCLYTGRFTESKGPVILAKAINYLQENGHNEFKGLFVGQGELEYENYIKECLGCTVQPFVTVSELTNYYQNFDIGIWPLQESTSQLDAAACGMPIIINEKVQDDFRSKGNGLQYKDCDYIDLASKILSLKSTELRNKMGIIGNKKITEFYSWNYLAKMKIVDFNKKY